MPRGVGGKSFHGGEWEGVSRKLVSSKAVPEDLNLKCRLNLIKALLIMAVSSGLF